MCVCVQVKEFLADPSKFAVAETPPEETKPTEGETKTEEKKEESEEESDEDMGFGEAFFSMCTHVLPYSGKCSWDKIFVDFAVGLTSVKI